MNNMLKKEYSITAPNGQTINFYYVRVDVNDSSRIVYRCRESAIVEFIIIVEDGICDGRCMMPGLYDKRNGLSKVEIDLCVLIFEHWNTF